jgi:hypothetical protein
MADRGLRCLAPAAVAAALLVLPAGASAELAPWLVGARYSQPTPAAPAAKAPRVAIRYAGRLPHRRACHGTVAVTLARGEGDALRRRTVRIGGGCRVRAAFSVRRSEIGGAAHLLVLQRYRGLTATARVSVPSTSDERLGSRGLDSGLATAPEALDY